MPPRQAGQHERKSGHNGHAVRGEADKKGKLQGKKEGTMKERNRALQTVSAWPPKAETETSWAALRSRRCIVLLVEAQFLARFAELTLSIEHDDVAKNDVRHVHVSKSSLEMMDFSDKAEHEGPFATQEKRTLDSFFAMKRSEFSGTF